MRLAAVTTLVCLIIHSSGFSVQLEHPTGTPDPGPVSRFGARTGTKDLVRCPGSGPGRDTGYLSVSWSWSGPVHRHIFRVPVLCFGVVSRGQEVESSTGLSVEGPTESALGAYSFLDGLSGFPQHPFASLDSPTPHVIGIVPNHLPQASPRICMFARLLSGALSAQLASPPLPSRPSAFVMAFRDPMEGLLADAGGVAPRVFDHVRRLVLVKDPVALYCMISVSLQYSTHCSSLEYSGSVSSCSRLSESVEVFVPIAYLLLCSVCHCPGLAECEHPRASGLQLGAAEHQDHGPLFVCLSAFRRGLVSSSIHSADHVVQFVSASLSSLLSLGIVVSCIRVCCFQWLGSSPSHCGSCIQYGLVCSASAVVPRAVSGLFCVVSSAVYGRCIPTVPSFTWAVKRPSRHCVGRNSALEACRFRQSFFVYSKRCCCDVSFFTAVVPSLSLSLLLPASVVPSGEAYSTVTSTQLIDQASCDCLWSASVWPWLCSRPRFMWSSTAKARYDVVIDCKGDTEDDVVCPIRVQHFKAPC